MNEPLEQLEQRAGADVRDRAEQILAERPLAVGGAAAPGQRRRVLQAAALVAVLAVGGGTLAWQLQPDHRTVSMQSPAEADTTIPGEGGNADPPETTELSAQFLKGLMPVSGDEFFRYTVGREVSLIEADHESLQCMVEAGYEDWTEHGLLEAQVFGGYAFLPSPSRLERSGFVAMTPEGYGDFPGDLGEAWAVCSGAPGTSEARTPSAVYKFLYYRDGTGNDDNPVSNWQDYIRAEDRSIAGENGAELADYRECFHKLGVPKEAARSGIAAFDFLYAQANEALDQADPSSDKEVEPRSTGVGVLDADGGVNAQSTATCLRLWEAHLSPGLKKERSEIVEKNREQLLIGQGLLNAAIGSDTDVADAVDGWGQPRELPTSAGPG